MTRGERSFQWRNPLVITLILVGVGFLIDHYVNGPKANAIDEAESRLDSLMADNRDLTVLVESADRTEVERLLAESEATLALIEGLLPSVEDLPGLLDLIGAEAASAGVEISLLQPLESIEEPPHVRHRYLVGVVGTYHRIGAFVSAIASLPRIVTPSDLTVVAREAADEASDTILEASFALETHVLSPDGSIRPSQVVEGQ